MPPSAALQKTCAQEGCGGRTIGIAKDGRFYVFKNIFMLVPTQVVIHRCTECDRDSPLQAELEEVTLHLQRSYEEHKSLILSIIRDYKERLKK